MGDAKARDNRRKPASYLLIGEGVRGEVRQLLPFPVSTGKRECDARGLNRFRLVVVCDDRAEQNELRDLFAAMTAGDERIHLQVIGERDNLFLEDQRGGPGRG